MGRVKTYEAIVKGENVPDAGVPESFKVLVKELQSLCLDVSVLNENDEVIDIKEDDDDIVADKGLGMDIGDIQPVMPAEEGMEEMLDEDLQNDGESEDDADLELDLGHLQITGIDPDEDFLGEDGIDLDDDTELD